MRIFSQSRFLLGVLSLAVIVALESVAWPQNLSTQQSQWSEAASMKIEGELLKIVGQYYVIKDDQGKETYLLITQSTKLSGSYKPGDRIEVWTSPIEHAVAIRADIQNRDDLAMESATYSYRGKLINIEGRYYVLAGADGKEKHFLIDLNTELAGEFRPGDQIEVLSSPLGNAYGMTAVKEHKRGRH